MTDEPQIKHWLALLALTLMWGSAYVLIELALISFSPEAMTLLRLLVAALLMGAIMAARGQRLPGDMRSWLYFSIVGLLGNCLPFYLTGLGQVSLDSGMAGLLLASTPLIVIALARDEPLTPLRLAGFVTGFGGVALLFAPEVKALVVGDNSTFGGYVAMLGAAACYAVTAVIVRRGPRYPLAVYTTGVMLVGCLILIPPVLIQDGLGNEVIRAATVGSWLAVAVLGAVCTGLAAVVYFYLVASVGAGFQALTNYLIPIWAVVTGFVFLGERLPARAYAALPVVLLGLYLVHRGGAAAAPRVR